jgi:Mg2+ and Co2+ transporter CorA
LADRTNDAMKALTVFAALILPLSVVTGIYGMNLEIPWPPPDHPLSFWGVLGAMILISAALLRYFRRKKWI